MNKKTVLAGLLPQELAKVIEKSLDKPIPEFRSKQICQWISQGVSEFPEMKNLPLILREELAEKCAVFSSSPGVELKDSDGTVKIQMNLEDGCKIEAVILHDGKGRKTACISTQAGCSCGCVFCKTGSLGFKRNLNAGEMAEELLFLRQRDPDISHIVIMGMGEPLFNLPELRKTIAYFTHKDGLAFSKRRITLSTAGVSGGLRDLADNGPELRLAFSLTSAQQKIREKLMPIAKTNPLPLLKESLLYYQKKQKQRITLEAVLLKGINTGEEEAAAMAEFSSSLDTVINLIPWNPVKGLFPRGINLETPSPEEIRRFISALEKRKLKVTTRMGKGQTIGGACGQLGS